MAVHLQPLERITTTAIWPLGGEPFALPRPNRHNDLIRVLAERGFTAGQLGPTRQGFMTSHGRFVDRAEARSLAEAAGQLLRPGLPGDQLYSEDLW